MSVKNETTHFDSLFTLVTERSRGALFTFLFCASVLMHAQSPTPPPNIKVILIRPNGGEVFLAGSDTLITWDSLKTGETVTIEYTTNGRLPANQIKWDTIAVRQTGTSYLWRVPATASDYCLARVRIHPGFNAPTIKICNQVWILKNLDIQTYGNGDSIPEVRDSIQWAHLTSGAWCYYNNDSTIGAIYGKLYNWYAVNDPRGLAPFGWHIPSDDEWKTLEMCLGMMQTDANAVGWRGNHEGSELKEKGIAHWKAPNSGSGYSNTSGYTALPGGSRDSNGSFGNLASHGYWWTSTEFDSSSAWNRALYFLYDNVLRSYGSKSDGISVRCVKD